MIQKPSARQSPAVLLGRAKAADEGATSDTVSNAAFDVGDAATSDSGVR